MYRFIRNWIQRVHLIYNIPHKVALNNFLSSAKIGKTILLTIDAGEKGLCFIDSFTKEERSGRVRTVLNGKEGTFQFL